MNITSDFDKQYKNIEKKLSEKEQIFLKKLYDSNVEFENLKKSCLENKSIWVNVHDEKGRICFWNDAAESISGYTAQEVTGSDEIWTKLYPEEDYRHRIINRAKGVVSNTTDLENLLTKIETKTGQSKYVMWNSNIYKDSSDNNCAISLGIDVSYCVENESEVKDLDSNLESLVENKIADFQDTKIRVIEEEQFASIGKLAAGIAHEINNPLGYVVSNIEILRDYVANYEITMNKMESIIENQAGYIDCKDHWKELNNVKKKHDIDYIKTDIKDIFEEIEEGYGRIAEITRSMHVFSDKRAMNQYEWYDINGGIIHTLNLLKNQLGSEISVDKKLGDMPNIHAIGNEINHVFLHLIQNSIQAIFEKNQKNGLIEITSDYTEKGIVISIEDNGIGIKDKDKPNIYNPFFTTKSIGSGKGLGLHIAKNIIVNQYDGEINLESEYYKGTKIEIKLPI